MVSWCGQSLLLFVVVIAFFTTAVQGVQQQRSCVFKGGKGSSSVTVANGHTYTADGLECTCKDGVFVDCHNPKLESVHPKAPTTAVTAAQIRAQFKATDFIFDLHNAKPSAEGAGGTLQSVTVAQMATLAEAGMAYTLLRIAPCGINTAHVHPRATEFQYVVSAWLLQTAFTEENPTPPTGGRVIVNEISTGFVTFFPRGTIHMEMNLGCQEAVMISAFNSEDPGTLSIAQRFFALPEDSVAIALGVPVDSVRRLRDGLPANPARRIAECQARCRAWGFNI